MKYQRKFLSAQDLDRMRINLAVMVNKLSPEPCCDFCGSTNPLYIYAAVRMSTGKWQDNWRWCACNECASDIEQDNWARMEFKQIKWLKGRFPLAGEGVLKSVVREAMSEFMMYAARVENGATH